MPNWDRECEECGFTGSYLDFEPVYKPGTDELADVEEQACVQRIGDEECGGGVSYRDDDDDDESEEIIAELVAALEGTTVQLAAYISAADEWHHDVPKWVREQMASRFECARVEIERARAAIAKAKGGA